MNYVNDVASNTGKGFTELSNVQSTKYSYDKIGSFTKDLNKGLGEIAYNCLNLPKKVVKGGQTIRYIYSATGEKLQNILPNKTITYNGGFVYEDGALQYILNEEGRYNVSGVNAGYEYNLKDHLGNVRMVINSSGSLRQSNNYYPFGGIFEQFSSIDNKYQYGGKELQEETDWLDFGARMYDSGIGRWLCFDPMAEKAANWTPYRYCFNNPMNVTDPTGLYEWNFDECLNRISYAGSKGEEFTQYVNNLSSGLQIEKDNFTFESFFGFNPEWYTSESIKDIEGYRAGLHGSELGYYKDVVAFNSGSSNYWTGMDWKAAECNYSFSRSCGSTLISKGGGVNMSYAGALTLAAARTSGGWTIAYGEPTWWGEVAMGVVTAGYAAYLVLNINLDGTTSRGNPTDWSFDPEINRLQNEKYYPQGSKPPKWFWPAIGAAGAYEFYKNWPKPNIQQPIQPVDNTYVAPVRPIYPY